MSEAPPPEAGNANGEYALAQMTNSPAVIAHLQQLASQAAAQQQLQDGHTVACHWDKTDAKPFH